jgi:hypothetical protein
MHDHRLDVDAIRKDALELSKILTAAKDVQWDPSPVTQAVDTVKVNRGGPPADAVSAVALDERRLAVREAVRAADAALRHVRASLTLHYTRVLRALEEWQGEEED